MPGRLIDEPRFKSLLGAVQKVVQIDGIDEKYILSSESKDTVTEDAVREIVTGVAEFDDWYFNPENPMNERVPPVVDDYSNHELAPLVREVVEYNLDALREIEDIIDPDQETLTNRLVGYIVNWQGWYYLYKVLQDQADWAEQAGIYDAVYRSTNYGDEENTGHLYQEE